MSKEITLKKFERVETTDKRDLDLGIVAFQLIEFSIDFYGNKIETTHDTRIFKDGTQEVIDGCGFIPAGYKIN